MAFSKHLRITYHPFFATLIDELCTEDEIVLSVNITIFYLILLNQSILTDLLMLPKYFVHTAHKHFHSTIYRRSNDRISHRCGAYSRLPHRSHRVLPPNIRDRAATRRYEAILNRLRK